MHVLCDKLLGQVMPQGSEAWGRLLWDSARTFQLSLSQ